MLKFKNGKSQISDNHYEGEATCPLHEEWDKYSKEAKGTILKIEEMHQDIRELVGHAKHLEKLDDISKTLVSMNKNLIGPATGRKQVPISVFILVMFIMGAVFILDKAFTTQQEVSIGATSLDIKKNDSNKR